MLLHFPGEENDNEDDISEDENLVKMYIILLEKLFK